MLSPKVLALLDYQFKLATAIKCIPFGWDNSRSIIKLVPLRKNTLSYYLSLLNTIVDSALTVVTCLGFTYYLATHKSDMSEAVPIMMFVGVLAVASSVSLLTNLQPMNFMIVANKLIQNNKYVERELHLHERYDRTLEIIVKLATLLSLVTPLLVYSFLTRPDGDENLFTFFGGTHWAGRQAFAIVSSFLLANKWVMVQTIVVLAFTLMFSLRVWLLIITTRYVNGEIKSEKAIHMHNCIQIFSMMNKTTFTWLLFPIGLVTISVVAVFALASLIVYHRNLTSQVAIILCEATTMCFFGVWVLFDLIREAGQNSKNLLSALEANCVQSQYLKRRVKACTPYSIQFGSLFKAKAVTVLTVLGFILQNTISLVILNKN